MQVNGNDITLEISASASSATKALDKFVSSLKSAKGVLSGKVNNGFASALDVDASKFERQLNSIDKSIERTQKKIEIFQKAVSTGLVKDDLLGEAKSNIAEHQEILSKLVEQRKELFDKVDSTQVEEAADDMRDLGKAAKDTGKELDGVGKSAKEAGENAEKSTSGFSKLVASIKRIMLYRAIRAVLKGITSAFKEGIKNIYEYSKAANTDFAPAMDKISTSVLYLKNGLGSLVAPLIQAVAPAIDFIIDKFVDLINIINQVIALLSGKSTYTKAIKYTTEYKDAAKDAANAAKDFALGFDELNVINASGGGANNSALDYDKMFEEAEVSGFLKENFQDILELAGLIGATILAWKLSDKFLADAGGLSTTLKGLVLLTVGFKLSYDAGYDIGKGQATLIDYVKAFLGPLAAGIGGALIGSVIPGLGTAAGFAIGVGVALVFELTGYVQGSLDKVIEAALYNGRGAVTITELANAFKNLAESITKIDNPIIESGKKISKAMEEVIEPATVKIAAIGTVILADSTTAETEIPKLISEFEKLRDGTKTVLDEVYQNVVYAVATSLSDALTAAGHDVPEIIAIITQVKGEVDNEMAEIETRVTNATKAYENHTLSLEDYVAVIMEAAGETSKLTDTVIPATAAFDEARESLSKIDWESPDAFDNAFKIIGDAANDAKINIDNAREAFSTNIETMRQWSDNEEYQAALTKVFNAANEVFDGQEDQIRTGISDLFNIVQTELINAGDDVVANARKEWEEKGFIGQAIEALFGTGANNAAEYAENALIEFKTGTIAPMEAKMQDIFDDFGMDVSPWASAAMGTVIDHMFDWYYDGGTNAYRVAGFADDMNHSVKEVLEPFYDEFSDYGALMTQGLIDGLSDEEKAAQTKKEIEALCALATVTAKDELEIHSPSQVFYEIGEYITQGLADGISESTDVVTSPIEEMVSKIISTVKNGLETGFETIKNTWSNLSLDSFKVKLPHFSLDGAFDIEQNKVPTVSVRWYAGGGFPENGEMFIAREAGPELVGAIGNRTAVANNDQIVEGIAGGVAEANAEQNALLREQNELLLAILNKTGNINLDGKKVTKAINSQNRANGAVIFAN